MPETLRPHPERAELGDLLARITTASGDGFLEAVSAADMDEVALLPAALPPAIAVLRDAGFLHLMDVSCTDHLPLTPRFEVAYHLIKIDPRRTDPRAPVPRIRLRVFCQDNDPAVPSLSSLWPSANWREREIFDLFGIRFDGHPNLRRIMMPDDWQGHPLRKDYPLRGTQRRFTPGGRSGPVPPVRG